MTTPNLRDRRVNQVLFKATTGVDAEMFIKDFLNNDVVKH